MAGISTAMCTSGKADFLGAHHCFNAVTTFTATGVSTQTWTSMSTQAGLAVGMVLSGTNVAANTILARFLSGTSIRVSEASTGAIGTVTATADAFKIGLFVASPAGTYGATTTNYTDVTGNSDELANGNGYTTGGTALTNVSPATGSGQAWVTFSPNPSWAGLTASTLGAFIYNTSQRGPVATPMVSVHSFVTVQTLANATLTILMPTAAANTAILAIQ